MLLQDLPHFGGEFAQGVIEKEGFERFRFHFELG
jgi:hypothetical protein